MTDPDLRIADPQPPTAPGPAPAARAPRATPSPAWIAAVAVAAAASWAYLPTLRELWGIWGTDPNYSHGYLVLPVAALVAWRLGGPRSGQASGQASGSAWGWAVLVASLSARAYFFRTERYWAGGIHAAVDGGRPGPGLRRLGVSAATMARGGVPRLPLPAARQFNDTLAVQLQSLATFATCRVLRGLGLWVLEEGNVIIVGAERLEVATACNGLSMLMSLSATVVTALLLVPMSAYKKAALLVSVVPIALASNVIRISATALCYQRFGREIGEKYAHDWAGFLMMPLALALVFLELGMLGWLFEESEESPAAAPAARLDFGGVVPSYGVAGPGGPGAAP